MTSSENAVLSFLLARRSCHKLAGPGPSPEQLNLILRAGMRVPDFQRLRPWRFLVAEGDGLDRLGAAMQRAAVAAGQPPEVVARAPTLPRRAPLVITVAAAPRPDKYAPAFDQTLSAGCTVMAMQMAALALGFAGVWRSGWLMHDRGFHRELGLADGDQIVGLLYLGRATAPPSPPPATEDPATVAQWL